MNNASWFCYCHSMRNKLIGVSSFIIAALMVATPAFASTLNRQLDQGMSGADVSAVQSFLAKDASLYPQGLVTGFFGPLTAQAVSNFQSRNGIAVVGRVGPITMAALNAQIDGGISGVDRTVPIISGIHLSVGTNSTTISWNTDELTRGTVYSQNSPLSMTEDTTLSKGSIGGTPTTDNMLAVSHAVTIYNLQSGTTYYYSIDTFDASGNETMTWPTTFRTN